MTLIPRSMLPSMLKTAITTFAIVATTAFSSFAADAPSPPMKAQMQKIMQQHPELMKEIMNNPNHMLAMAYRHNLVSFARALKKAAQQGDTVPPAIARTAVDEMERSVEQLDKQHAEFFRTMPEKKKALLGDLPKLMNDHLADLKKSIAHLQDVVKSDKIDSKHVIKDMQSLLQKCEVMHGYKMKKGPEEMMRHREMMKEMKARDAEMMELVDRMNRAPDAKKGGMMADILTRLVKQRAEMNARMAEMHHHGTPQMQMDHKSMRHSMMEDCCDEDYMEMDDTE